MYSGLTIEGESVDSPLQDSGTDFSYFPIKDVSWNWLAIQTSNTLPRAEPKNLCEIGVQVNFTEESAPDGIVVKALTKEAERYRTKYKQLKSWVKSQNK